MSCLSSFSSSRLSIGRLFCAVTAALIGLSVSGAASATVCDPCRVYVMPGSTSVVFPVTGSVAEPGDSVSPALGKDFDDLQHGVGAYNGRTGHYTYTPQESFWATGIDQVTFRVESSGSPPTHRSVIFLSGNTDIYYESAFNFEQAPDLSAWTVFPMSNGRQPEVYLEQGSQGNVLTVSSVQGTAHGVQDGGQAGQTEAHVAALGGQTEGSTTDLPGHSSGLEHREMIFDISDIVSIEKKTEGGVSGTEATYARGRINPDYFSCVPRDEDPTTSMPCETEWLEVTVPHSQMLVVEVGLRMLGVDIPRPWSLQFAIEDLDGNQLSFHEVWTNLETQLPSLLQTQVGSMSVASSVSAIHSIQSAYSFAALFSDNAAVFREDFDELAASGLAAGIPSWTRDGEEAQFLDGLFSASGTVDELALFSDLDMLIPSTSPSGYVITGEAGDRTTLTYDGLNQENEVRLKMSVRTRPSTDDILVDDYYPAWTSFEMLRIGKFDGTPDFGPVSIRFATDASGTRRFRLRVYGNTGGILYNGWLTSPNQKVALSLYWKRNTNGTTAPNGEVRLVVDGQELAVTGIENSGQVAEYVTLGAWDLNLVHLPPEETLPFGFDDIVIVGDENSAEI